MDPASFGLAIGGIVLAFKGAVDGYLLIEEFFDKDNGMRDAVVSYHTERRILILWGDQFRVNDPDQTKCPLNDENKLTQESIINTLARIKALHTEIRDIIDIQSLVSPPAGGSRNAFDSSSQIVDGVSKIQLGKKLKNSFTWAIKNKAKFLEVVRKLRNYNDDLVRLLRYSALASFESMQPSYILAGLNDNTDMQILQDLTSKRGLLVDHAAKLKSLQASSSGIRGEHDIKFHSLDFSASGSDARHLGIYSNMHRVWVEWRTIDSNLSASAVETVRNRIEALGAMLQTVNVSELRIPTCLGLLREDDAHYSATGEERIGFLYEVPKVYAMNELTSLLDVIRTTIEPPLGEKFRLAVCLARALYLLHSSNWLHKAFRSDNILFFNGKPEKDTLYKSIRDPFITGFEYSRDAKDASVGYRPSGATKLDYYYHPDIVNGATKTFDLYSLGVVLLEIAWWEPLSEEIETRGTQGLSSIRELFIQGAAESLDSRTGDIYGDVVRKCLEASLKSDDQATFAFATANQIILKLESCNA